MNTAMRHALKQLIPAEELHKIATSHIAFASANRGTEQYQAGIGMFGRSGEQVSTDAQTAGRIGGKQAYQQKVGVHSLSAEERSTIGRKGGTIGAEHLAAAGKGVTHLTPEQRVAAVRKSHESRGIAAYTGTIIETEYGNCDERDYIVRLKEDEAVFVRDGGWQGLTNKVNQIFNNQRTVGQLQSIYYKHKVVKDK